MAIQRGIILYPAFLILITILPVHSYGQDSPLIVDKQILRDYISAFNKQDHELYIQDIPNNRAEEFLKNNIPLLDCPDKQLETTYYFRWWTYRKHVKQTPEGYVISEFLPDVAWAGKHNTISCAAGHHFYEGRWLHNPEILAEYARFWLTGGGNPRLYSFWIADAVYNYYLIHPDKELIRELYPHLKENFSGWETEKRDSTGLFWQVDDRDGMESSISGKLAAGGKGYRATINSYMYGEVHALSKIAMELGLTEEAVFHKKKAEELKKRINEQLWDTESSFYKVIPRNGENKFSPVRELHGYTPWYFNIPPASYSCAWRQLTDPEGFFAPYGPTTVEQRSPDFTLSYKGHECQWNGPSWPYSTSVTLTGLANLLNNYPQTVMTAKEYMILLKQYSTSHQLRKEDGEIVPWIDENLHPFTGDWISRTRLKSWKDGTWDAGKGGQERGKDYNHSSFCDLVISGLAGVRPQTGNTLLINPLLPDGWWDYFCLDNLLYKNHIITILYDKSGERYNLGTGFRIFVDGELKAKANQPQRIELSLGK